VGLRRPGRAVVQPNRKSERVKMCTFTTNSTGHKKNQRSSPRRGSIYIVTLMTSIIVAAMAIGALATVRVQRRHAADADAARQAQLHAESALQLARYFIRTSSSWRSDLNNGRWSTDQPIGNGYYSFTGTDPADGDVLNNAFDPVIIRAVGKEADCVHVLTARFELTQPGLSCLQSGIHANYNLSTQSITLTSSGGPLTSNINISIGPQSIVTADCEANGSVSVDGTATLTGTRTNGANSRQMPNSADVLSYYQGLGTTISATSLPLWDRQYLQNGGAEDAVATPWIASNCAVALSSTITKSGAYSFYVYNRTVLLDGVKQDITSQVAQNVQYSISGSVYIDDILAADSFRLHILLKTSNGDVSFTSPWASGVVGSWVSLSYTPTLTWTGTLNNAYLYVQSSLGLAAFYFDDISMKETGAAANTYVIHRQLLSSQSNPFTGVLNANGIYVLNCAGNTVNIRSSRILGTLILVDPKSDSRIEGSMFCEPQVVLSTNPSVPNLPAVLANSELELAMESTALSEAIANVNFNPAGSSYGGSVDTDRLDSYPSQISGIVFSSKRLRLSNRTTISGSVVVDEEINVVGSAPGSTSVTVNYQPLYYYVNPPIGFRGTPVVRLRPDSVEQVVQ
jgi:hypothetical protein